MKKIIVCTHHRKNPSQPSCAARGGVELVARLAEEIRLRGWDIGLDTFACLGHCEEGPTIKLLPDGPFCTHITPESLPSVLEEIERFSQGTTEPSD